MRFGGVGFALDGTEALVAGAGAEPRVRPGPSKPSLDCLPQRLPICVAELGRIECEDREGGGGKGQRIELRRSAEVSLEDLVGEWLCVP